MEKVTLYLYPKGYEPDGEQRRADAVAGSAVSMAEAQEFLERVGDGFARAVLIADDGEPAARVGGELWDTVGLRGGAASVFQHLCHSPAEEQLWITSSQRLIDECRSRRIAVIGLEGQGKRLSCPYVFQRLSGVSYRDLERVYRRYRGLPWEILETDRCRLREFSMEDLDDLFALYAKPHVMDYVEPLYPYEEEREYQRGYISQIYGYYGYGMWLVFDRASGNLIGRAGLESRETCGEGEAELGYIIAPEYQRRGIATEVCRGILEYGRKELGLTGVLSRVHPANLPSVALMRTLGFREREKIGEERIYEKALG